LLLLNNKLALKLFESLLKIILLHLFRFSKNKNMQSFRNLFVITLFCTLFTSCKNNENQIIDITDHRIISLSGSITEILAELGFQQQIIGVDVTSTYPQDIKQQAKDLGHVNGLSIENIIALQPTLVLASENLKPELINSLKGAKIQVKIITKEESISGTKKFIKDVAQAIGDDSAYVKLVEQIDADAAGLQQFETKPKVLFIYARGAGTLMVAGKNTPMEKMIAIAGGENAVNDFEDYKPLTSESLIQTNPDYILLFEKGLESLGGIDGLLEIQGISQTNAGKNRKVITMDGALLSGFGPRVGKAAKELNELLSK
jgi:iron complex transport system substrate-binding protein